MTDALKLDHIILADAENMGVVGKRHRFAVGDEWAVYETTAEDGANFVESVSMSDVDRQNAAAVYEGTREAGDFGWHLLGIEKHSE